MRSTTLLGHARVAVRTSHSRWPAVHWRSRSAIGPSRVSREVTQARSALSLRDSAALALSLSDTAHVLFRSAPGRTVRRGHVPEHLLSGYRHVFTLLRPCGTTTVERFCRSVRPLVIVPTYNERDNIVPFITAVLATHPALHVLIVDDNSPDGTGALADRLADQTGRVWVHHRASKQGLGTAYIAGFKFALERDYDRVVTMDADFSHRPEDLPRLLEAADTNDLVIGSRAISGGRVEGWPLSRHIVSKGGSLYARLLLGLPIHDCTGGFKCLRRAALEALDLDRLRSNGYGFSVEVNYACAQAGLRIVEIPIVFPDRTRGESKMSSGIVVEAATLVLRLRLGLQPVALRADRVSPAALSGLATSARGDGRG